MKRIVAALVLFALAANSISCKSLSGEGGAALSAAGAGDETADRFYISDRYSPFDVCAFSGASPGIEGLGDLCAELDGAAWIDLPDALLAQGMALDIAALFDKIEEENRSVSNTDNIRNCSLGTTHDGRFAFIKLSGRLSVYVPSVLLYFRLEDDAYLPYMALLALEGINSDIRHAAAGGCTWLIAEYDTGRGSFYRENTRSWFNLDSGQPELCYLCDYYGGGAERIYPESTESNVYCIREFAAGEERLLTPEETCFSVEVTVALNITLDYYAGGWEALDLMDNLTREIAFRFTYDPGAHAFYTQEPPERYFLTPPAGEAALPDGKIASLFGDELDAMAKDCFAYRAGWAKKVLNSP